MTALHGVIAGFLLVAAGLATVCWLLRDQYRQATSIIDADRTAQTAEAALAGGDVYAIPDLDHYDLPAVHPLDVAAMHNGLHELLDRNWQGRR